MSFTRMSLLGIVGVLLIELEWVHGTAASSEQRVIVYREIGEDGYPAEHKTLTFWDYPKPTTAPQENYNPVVEPVHQEEEQQFIPVEEHLQTQNDSHLIKDNIQDVATPQIMDVMPEGEPDLQPNQVIPEEAPIDTITDPPTEEVVVVDPIDDEPAIITVITETVSSVVTIPGTSITTITVTQGTSSDGGLFQNAFTSTFSIAKDDLLFRANRGQRHNTDSMLYIAMVIVVVLGVL